MGRRLAWASSLLVVLTCAASASRGATFDPQGWVEARTSHFVLYSDAGRERAEEIATSLETFRSVFARLAPELELRSPTPTRILAFRDAESFAPYKTQADRGEARVLGQFLSYRDGNYLTVNSDPRYLGAFAVTFHEYVHYLVRFNFPQVPRWFNEGLAEYYSTFAVEGAAAVVGRPVGRHVRWLAQNELGLREVLSRSQQLEETAAADRDGRFYASSWGLVHYLLSGGRESSNALAELLLPAAPGEDPVDRFERALGARLEEVERRLQTYLLAPQLPVAALPVGELPAIGAVEVRSASPAKVLATLGGLLTRIGQESAAERQVDLALRYDSRLPEALAELAQLRDRQDRRTEASVLYREATADDPDDARVWLLYGRHQLDLLLGGGPDPEDADRVTQARSARDAFARAAEIDPDFAEVQALLGYSHLFGDLEAASGIPYLERAIDLLPGRGDLQVALVQLLLKDEQPKRARAVIETELVALGAPDLVDRAREEVERWELLRASDAALRTGSAQEAVDLFEAAVAMTTDLELRARMELHLEALRDGLARGSVR